MSTAKKYKMRERIAELEQDLRRTQDQLRAVVKAYSHACKHITDDLQPEFQRIADGKKFSWPDSWSSEPYNKRVAAQRLATWWHGAETEDLISVSYYVLKDKP